jgi:hypothetical protein
MISEAILVARSEVKASRNSAGQVFQTGRMAVITP